MEDISPSAPRVDEVIVEEKLEKDEYVEHIDKPDVTYEDAARAEDWEHSLGFWQSIRIYKVAVWWSFVASMSIIMEAYDVSVGGGASLLEYRKYFGTYYPALNDWQLTAGWQGALSQAGNIGNVLGIFIGTYTIDRFGYRKTLLFNYAIIMPFIAINVFAQNKPMLLCGGILCGIPWGLFSTLSEAYASEICPLSLRAYMTGWVNLCWNIGGFIGSGITLATQGIPNNYSWRVPFMTHWLFPMFLFAAMWFAPESPWWLVRHGKLEEAEKSIKKLNGKEREQYSHETVANMVRTNNMELEHNRRTKQESKWIELFRGTDLRRTEISVLAFVIQNANGVIFVGNFVYVFEQAGISQSTAFKLGWGNSALQLVMNFFNFWLIHTASRRTIMISGFIIMDTLLIIIGVMAILGDRGNDNARWAQAALSLLFNMTYTGFTGPITYSIVSEASATRLRNKTIGLSRGIYIVYSLCMYIMAPYMVNPTAWNWKGKAAFFWVPFCTASLTWLYFRLPEFKGRSYYELDVMFQRKIPARKFKTTVVERHAEQQEGVAEGVPPI